MNDEARELLRSQIHELVDIIIDTNGFESRQKGKTGSLPTVFAEYSGHVNHIAIRLNTDGWGSGACEERILDTYLDKSLSQDVIDSVRERCKAALTDKKESDVLRRDIESKESEISEKKAELKSMKKNLRKLEAKGR